jgi:microcystin-dependent protein
MTTRIQTFDGNIGIGTNDPGSYKLRVEGSVKANSLEINGVTNAQVPIGLIAMWYGSVASIPTGWALCDGTTGITRSDGSGTIDTPNLSNKFVRGADGDAPSPAVPGQNGGANTVTLAETNLPAHAHPVTVNTANANHNHNTNTANAPHGHQTQWANAPHAHNVQVAGNNAPHYHTDRIRAVTNYRGYNRVPSVHYGDNANLANTNTGWANAPHGHNGYAQGNNAPHYHGVNGANAPHNHGINAVDAPHSHTAYSGQIGSGTAITVTNPYYILAYIMKI